MGKSSTANSLLNEQTFVVTPFQQDIGRPVMAIRSLGGFQLRIIDTPGLVDGDTISERVRHGQNLCSRAEGAFSKKPRRRHKDPAAVLQIPHGRTPKPKVMRYCSLPPFAPSLGGLTPSPVCRWQALQLIFCNLCPNTLTCMPSCRRCS